MQMPNHILNSFPLYPHVSVTLTTHQRSFPLQQMETITGIANGQNAKNKVTVESPGVTYNYSMT